MPTRVARREPPRPESPAFTGWMVARGTMVLLTLAGLVAAQVPARFSLGDPRERVRQIQGSPSLIERLYSLGIERWTWEGSTVTFDPSTGQVVGWHDPARRLRATLRPAHRARDSVLTLGMPLGDVARLFGTPWAVTPAPQRGQVLLSYGRSAVRIDRVSNKVSGWARGDTLLRTSPIDDPAAHIAVGALPPTPGQDTAPHPGGGFAQVVIRVDSIRDRDGDGRLAPREFADVSFRVTNTGRQWSPPLRAQYLHAPGIATLAGTPDTVWLAALAPGDSADLSIALYTTGVVQDPELTLVVWAGHSPTRHSIRVPTLAPVVPAATRDEPRLDVPRPGRPNPDALAVVIGIERYQRLPSAPSAARDAALIRSYLTTSFGVPPDASHLVMRTDAAASGSELRRLLDDRGWLARRATENTDVIVYFAGHGAATTSQVPYLLPADADASYVEATGLDLHALFERLARLPARSVTVILDACFSGLGRGGRPLVAGQRAAVVSLEHPALLRRQMAVFTASRGAQAAGELPGTGHGTFTWGVARGLQGAADTDLDGAVTVAELGHFVEREVRTASARLDREQEPLAIARDTARVLVRFAGARP